MYELIDFGEGRKLERFGPYLLDRPAPAAEGIRRALPAEWPAASARYERNAGERGEWQPAAALPATWNVELDNLRFEIKPTEFGHVGLFPEQRDNWRWLRERVMAAGQPLKVLNLFAYTGGSTVAASQAGATVAHVDAARNIVTWARRNFELNGMGDRPVRWICEDAPTFVRRELKRGNRYDAIILDPPSFGHGPAGELWKFQEHLTPLLRECVELTGPDPRFILLTAHTTGIRVGHLSDLFAEALAGGSRRQIEASEMTIADRSGRLLPCGVAVRCFAQP